MEQFIKVNGKAQRDTVMEYKFGLMVENMKVIGAMTKHMAKENFIMQMVMFMMVCGKRIRQMALVFTYMSME